MLKIVVKLCPGYLIFMLPFEIKRKWNNFLLKLARIIVRMLAGGMCFRCAIYGRSASSAGVSARNSNDARVVTSGVRILACFIEIKILIANFFHLGLGKPICIFIESDTRYRKSANWSRLQP
jgi:hypothetical protein